MVWHDMAALLQTADLQDWSMRLCPFKSLLVRINSRLTSTFELELEKTMLAFGNFGWSDWAPGLWTKHLHNVLLSARLCVSREGAERASCERSFLGKNEDEDAQKTGGHCPGPGPARAAGSLAYSCSSSWPSAKQVCVGPPTYRPHLACTHLPHALTSCTHQLLAPPTK